ncbi:MAG: ABC transporter permease [Ruminococcaceae bacterium]|nr:ABC transporter permease [Oscillospiraceae bacterium]
MFRYFIKRLVSVIPVFICISILLFGIVKKVPGDPVRRMIPPGLSPEQDKIQYERMYIKLGLNKSLPEQYFRWIVNMFQGDFGHSSNYNRPVKDAIKAPIKNTLYLNIIVTILQLGIVIPVGIRCATKRFSLFDNFWQVFSLITYSMPAFFVGISLIYIFGITLRWFPIGGLPNAQLLSGMDYFWAYLNHAALPAITLTIIGIAGTIRYVRNAMIDALNQDYIRTARSKGLSERVVVYSHAFRNALIPVSTILIGSIFSMFVGSPITETVFAWDGLGRVLIKALSARDYMMVITINWFFAVFFVIGNLAADITYGIVDPRVKLQ